MKLRGTTLRVLTSLGAGAVALAIATPTASNAASSLAMRPKAAGSGPAATPGSRVARLARPALGNLVTYDYDNARSGDDTTDARIAALAPSATWDDNNLDGAVYGEPLIYNSRAYVATEGDTLYALAARSGRVLWQVQVGSPVSLSVVNTTPGERCGNINLLGITGTPVIDPSSNEIFVAAEVELPGKAGWPFVRHELIAISLTTQRVLWRRDADPPGANNPAIYYIPAELQRPALTLANGRIYVAYGGMYGDCGQYHGYVVESPETGKGALQSYEVPTKREGAIWETNGALVAPNGDLFVATGNSSSNSAASFDQGNSVVELSPTLHLLGVWAPSNWVQLNDADWDLGSGGPIQVPGTDLLFVAGKPTSNGSYGYLLGENKLRGIGGGAFRGLVCSPGAGGVYGADASEVRGSITLLFAPCGSGTEAIAVTTAPMSFQRLWSAPSGAPNGPPIVAGGLLWALNWNDGHLYGMSPTTGVVRIERPTDPLVHFATPAVGDKMLLVPTAHGVEGFRAIS